MDLPSTANTPARAATPSVHHGATSRKANSKLSLTTAPAAAAAQPSTAADLLGSAEPALGSSDPFCILTHGGQTIRSKVFRGTLQPGFDLKCTFEYIPGRLLELELWDLHEADTNECLGSLCINPGELPIGEHQGRGLASRIVWLVGLERWQRWTRLLQAMTSSSGSRWTAWPQGPSC